MAQREASRSIRTSYVVLVLLGTGMVLFGLLYLTFGTAWGWEVQLFRWVVPVSLLPLVAAILSGRDRFRVPAGLFFLGVLGFWIGAAGGGCVQPGIPESASWGIEYDWGRNMIFFGWPYPTFEGYTCYGEPNRLLVLAGYLVSTIGVTLGVNRLR